MQTTMGRGPKNGWRVFATMLLIALISSIFTMDTVQAKKLQQLATTPLSQVSCGSITAATYPSFSGSQTAVLPAQSAMYAGAILAPSDGMTITVGSQNARRYNTPNGNMWQQQVAASSTMTITTSTGPDNIWAAYTAGSDFVVARESLGDASLYDVYEVLKFGIVVDKENTQICFMGAFNDTSGPDIVFQVWNGLTKLWEKRVSVSEVDGVLDLVEATVNTPIGTKLDIVVTVLENPSQIRQEYFLAGFGLDGAHLEDNDGDGDPDDNDPDPTTPRQCVVNVSSTDPMFLTQPAFIDVTFSGDCGNAGIVSYPPGELTGVERATPTGQLQFQTGEDPSCFDSGDGRVICELGTYTRFRIHLVPNRLGIWTGKVTLSLDALAYQYWNGRWEVIWLKVADIFLPLINR